VPRFEVGESYRLTLDLHSRRPIAPAYEEVARIDLADQPEGLVDPGPYYNIVGRVWWRPKDSPNTVVISVDQLFFGLKDPAIAPDWDWVSCLATVDVEPDWLSVAGDIPEVTHLFTVGRIIQEYAPPLPLSSEILQDITQDITDWSRYRSEEATRAEPWLFDGRDHQLRRYLLGIRPLDDSG